MHDESQALAEGFKAVRLRTHPVGSGVARNACADRSTRRTRCAGQTSKSRQTACCRVALSLQSVVSESGEWRSRPSSR
jgi:hypothetical protein